MNRLILLSILTVGLVACVNTKAPQNMTSSYINSTTSDQTIGELTKKYGEPLKERITRGVIHIASLWRKEDGTADEFKSFCLTNFIADEKALDEAFKKSNRALEQLYGHNNLIYLELQRPLHEPMGEITPIDELFGSFSPDAHLNDDLFKSKLAFIIALNFPYYKLAEKNAQGTNWNRQQWAYARLGDVFSERIPAELIQKNFEALSKADIYISQFNISAGRLVNDSMKSLFPNDMVLLAHWNIRDEIKANFKTGATGLEKQKTLYQVMLRIIDQSIPKEAINDSAYQWNPFTNKLYRDNAVIAASGVKDERYEHIINNFQSNRLVDSYSPMKTFIERSFDGGMEISQPEIEQLFTRFLSSDVIKEVANVIKNRLGRDLQPWDIWYDGFKARNTINESELDQITEKKYPDASAFQKDIPNMLLRLGFTPEKAAFIASYITVDPARGSGHAWGAQMRGVSAHLRTRIPSTGMNYKGYNIAIHELGHNVEQTISMNWVDYYLLNGVPNTAFTEALAFIFQKRDLYILGMENNNPNKAAIEVLDNFWSTYEIMGVSLLDQYTWKWLYDHPNATPSQLKEAVAKFAIDIWNQYYAPVFGVNDQPILAIYSHMINNPLYLSNYAVGNLIEFQIEQYLKTSQLAYEVERMYKIGSITPSVWMKQAVGSEISIEPIINATEAALKQLK